MPILNFAYTQTLWQFADTMSVSKLHHSSQQAKENAVMTLVYINTLRITLALMLLKNDGQLMTIEFVTEMAAIKNDEDMKKFVNEKFRPLITDKANLLGKFPTYKDGIQPLVQLISYLFHIRKDVHAEELRHMHGLLITKLEDDNFQQGTHRLILSVIAALMTQSDQALRMYPILSALGKYIFEKIFYT